MAPHPRTWRRHALWLVLIVTALAPTPQAQAHEARETRARALYTEGKQSFEAERFEEAYARFRQAYLLSHAPELLYNMASALEAQGRPHDAAEELRGYLRARPDDPQRPLIEGRVRTLEEAQRLLDAERLKAAPPPKLLALPQPQPYWTRRRIALTIVGTLAGVLAAGAVGVGLGLGLKQEIPATKLGNWPGTP